MNVTERIADICSHTYMYVYIYIYTSNTYLHTCVYRYMSIILRQTIRQKQLGIKLVAQSKAEFCTMKETEISYYPPLQSN